MGDGLSLFSKSGVRKITDTFGFLNRKMQKTHGARVGRVQKTKSSSRKVSFYSNVHSIQSENRHRAQDLSQVWATLASLC
jgi:hypothetical protein